MCSQFQVGFLLVYQNVHYFIHNISISFDFMHNSRDVMSCIKLAFHILTSELFSKMVLQYVLVYKLFVILLTQLMSLVIQKFFFVSIVLPILLVHFCFRRLLHFMQVIGG